MAGFGIRERALLCIVPLGGAVAVIFTMVMPAFDEFNQKQQAVDAKKSEQHDLQTKLLGKAKIAKEKKQLDDTISQLRAAVPKAPELEILNLDMEKMALDSGLELISFSVASKEVLKKAGMEEVPEAGSNVTKGKQALADKVAKTVAPAAAAANAVAGKVAAPAAAKPTDAGLAKITLEIRCIGDYAAIERMVRKLETYKRVVAIAQVKTWVPKLEKDKKGGAAAELPDDGVPAEGEDQGDWHKLWSQFLLTAYYLP